MGPLHHQKIKSSQSKNENEEQAKGEEGEKVENVSYFSFGEEKEGKIEESKKCVKEKKSFYENVLAPSIGVKEEEGR